MIFFVANDGTIIKGMPSPVYQGAANSNTIYLIAPFASNTAVTVAFRLPNGVVTSPAAMTAQNALQGIVNAETGQTYAGWTYDLPSGITELYGTVTVQFFFYSAEAGVITATSATSFEVGRGVPAVLPETPEDDVYENILSNLAALQTQLNNGTFAARSIYAWNSTYTYGANEITFYPDIGDYGAFVQSVQTGNTGHMPYTNGSLNSTWWKEVVNFNNITEDYLKQLNDLIDNAETNLNKIASDAEQSFNATLGQAQSAQAAAEEAESNAQTQAQAAASSAAAAEESADAAESAKAAAQTAQNAAESAAENAQAYAGQASGSASASAQSASAAAASANRAQEIVNGIGSVYKPVGSIAFSALPATPAAAQQGYVYNITDAFTTDARFVEGAGKEYPAGTNVAVVLNGSAYMYDALSGNVDLSNYAQTNGTYPNMTVGNATQAGSANDPSAVHFTAQTLTDEQKAQARTNIGVTQGTDGLDALTYSDICTLTSVPSLSQQYSFDRSKFNRALEFHDIFICPSEYIADGVTRTWLVVFEVIEPLLNSDCRIKAFVETTGAKGEKGDKGDPGEGGGGSGGSLYLHRVCLPLSAITTASNDIAIFSIYLSSPTPFTIETFFEWLISHFAGVPESYFDNPSLPAFSCVSTYSKGDSSGQSMYPAILTYIVDNSENQGEPAYEITISGEETLGGSLILSQVEEATFIDTVTEV